MQKITTVLKISFFIFSLTAKGVHFYLPCAYQGMDSETKLSFEKDQKNLDQKWRGAIFTSSKPLESEENFKTLPGNMQKQLSGVYLGDGALLKERSRIFEPVICLYEKNILLGLSVINSISGELEQFLYRVQDKKANLAAEGEQLITFLKKEDSTFNNQSSGFKLAMTSSRTSSFGKKISSYCLELILAKKLLEQEIRVINGIQNELITTIDHWIKFTKQAAFYYPTKATRHMNLIWSLDKAKIGEVGIKIDFSEAVLGSLGVTNFNLTVPYKLNEQTKIFDFELPKDVTDFLNAQKEVLSLDEPPGSVLIKKAWVYLDKGRSWGLQINDRLVEKNQPQAIKGHIVGFFGTELMLRDKKNRLIHDGAILFIRKGQHLTKKDQSFVYDERSYPTPWPPTAEK